MLNASNFANSLLGWKLRSAVEEGETQNVKKMINQYRTVMNTEYCKTLLIVSAGFGRLDTLEFLVGEFKDSLQNSCFKAALSEAVEKGHLEVITFLMFDFQSMIGNIYDCANHVFIKSCDSGQIEIIKFIMDYIMIPKDNISSYGLKKALINFFSTYKESTKLRYLNIIELLLNKVEAISRNSLFTILEKICDHDCADKILNNKRIVFMFHDAFRKRNAYFPRSFEYKDAITILQQQACFDSLVSSKYRVLPSYILMQEREKKEFISSDDKDKRIKICSITSRIPDDILSLMSKFSASTKYPIARQRIL